MIAKEMVMSEYGQRQAQKDVNDGRSAADMRNAHWKERQDYEAAFAHEKAKQGK